MVGMVAVLIFMLVYYHGAGINADLALILNLVILLGFLGFSGATLTLPGIAGVILTVGMGVDSNVLIFERIREELRNGKTPPSAVEQGFGHAWITIVDTHVTTIVSAAILFHLRNRTGEGFCRYADLWFVGEPVHGGIRFARDFRLDSEPQTARRSSEHLEHLALTGAAVEESDVSGSEKCRFLDLPK